MCDQTWSMITLRPRAWRPIEERVEVGQGPEQGIDVAIVADVVAEVLHRRGEEGREPDPVDAEAGDVVEPLDDALQVADAIAVRSRESCADRSGRSPRRATIGFVAALTGHRISLRRGGFSRPAGDWKRRRKTSREAAPLASNSGMGSENAAFKQAFAPTNHNEEPPLHG